MHPGVIYLHDTSLEQCFKQATRSIEDAEAVMASTKTLVEKAKASKDGRNKIVSKASDIVNALLEPASQVANLLNGLGAFFPPCGVAGSVLQVRYFRLINAIAFDSFYLQGIVDLESDRRENDSRIGLVFADIVRRLIIELRRKCSY